MQKGSTEGGHDAEQRVPWPCYRYCTVTLLPLSPFALWFPPINLTKFCFFFLLLFRAYPSRQKRFGLAAWSTSRWYVMLLALISLSLSLSLSSPSHLKPIVSNVRCPMLQSLSLSLNLLFDCRHISLLHFFLSLPSFSDKGRTASSFPPAGRLIYVNKNKNTHTDRDLLTWTHYESGDSGARERGRKRTRRENLAFSLISDYQVDGDESLSLVSTSYR